MTLFWIKKSLCKELCISRSVLFATPFVVEGFPLERKPAGSRAWLPGVDLDWWEHSNLLTPPSALVSGLPFISSLAFSFTLSPRKAWGALGWSVAVGRPHVMTCVDSLAYPFMCLLTPTLDSDSSLGNASSLVSDCGWVWELHVILHLPLSDILILAFWHCGPTWVLTLIPDLKSFQVLCTYVCLYVCMYVWIHVCILILYLLPFLRKIIPDF